MRILDIRIPWRDSLLPASYKNAEFHIDSMSESNGRRLVSHQFPKREKPYAEDMGRRAFAYSVRAYCITFMVDTEYPVYRRDYRTSRDALRAALDAGGAGRLQLPTLPAVIVACDRYQMTEETRFGGYCSFDMSFVEQGEAPPPPATSSRDILFTTSKFLVERIVANLGKPDVPLDKDHRSVSRL